MRHLSVFASGATWLAPVILLLHVMLCVRTVEAQASDQQRPAAWTHSSGTTFRLFPSGDVYPVYVADPHRATNTITALVLPRLGIEQTSTPRIALGAGGRFGMLRIDSGSPGGRSWQVSIEAGLDAVFDSDHKQDAIGWDGNYGLTVTTVSGWPLAFKFAVLHQSSHLGDEYSVRTGRARLNYTREEFALGVGWRIPRGWRAYGETAVAYVGRYEGQEPWRAQGGLEYESRPIVFGGRFAWYGAADFSGWEERAWRLDTALRGGIMTRTDGRTYRIGVGWTDGPPPLGEFFQLSEGWFTFGLWIDL
jgi:hypothetical protein